VSSKNPFIVEPLGKQHDKTSFSCGVQELDNYLKNQAGQDAKKKVSAPFVLIDTRHDKVAGYYTLSMDSVLTKDLPETTTRKLPRYPALPSVLMGRLAVDQSYKGQKLGAFLLIDALKRAYEISTSIAATFFIVDAKDKAAKSFYEYFGFEALEDDQFRLYLAMKSAEGLFKNLHS
jgi:predicted GNAT family N-acyltransferase